MIGSNKFESDHRVHLMMFPAETQLYNSNSLGRSLGYTLSRISINTCQDRTG